MRTDLVDRIFQLAELSYVFEIYEVLSNGLSPRLRQLNARECDFLTEIFGESIPYERIRVDERAHIGPRRYRFFYVSFHTINSWGPVPPPILVHEVVHIWQYLYRGALYIPRALAAQRSRMGYDYGGLDGLRRAESLDDFNYEQMAAVIEDAFRAKQGYPLRYLREPSPSGNAAVMTSFWRN